MTVIFALLAAAALVGIDQYTKYLVHANFVLYESRTFISGIIDWHYVDNKGAAFGILANHRWVFMIITTLVIAVGLIALISGKIKSKWLIWSAALIISGGVGNMIDRIGRGYVVDFIELKFMDFYIFNIADICVVAGALMMIAYFIKDTVKDHKEKMAEIKNEEDSEKALSENLPENTGEHHE